jgi:hypothetical protein
MRKLSCLLAALLPATVLGGDFISNPSTGLYPDKVAAAALAPAQSGTNFARAADFNQLKYALLDTRDAVWALQSGATGGSTGGVVTQPYGSQLHVDVDNWPSIQPVTASSLPLPAGAATEATLAAMSLKFNGTIAVSDSKIPAGLALLTGSPTGSEAGLVTRNIPYGTQAVTGTGSAGSPASGIVTVQGNASGTPIPISGSITATNASVGTNGATAVSSSTLIAGKSSSAMVPMAVDPSGNVGVNVQNLTTVTPGQATMAASVPVAIASDQGSLPVTVSNVTTVSPGQATMASSVPVVIASDQGALPVTVTGLPASLGQKTASASMPVVLPSDMGALATIPGLPAGATDFQCSIPATSTSTTQCAAAPGAGRNFYLTHVSLSNGSTAQTLQVVQGTGSTCTTPTAVASAKSLAANSGVSEDYALPLAWKGSAANAALCVTPGAAGAFGADIRGYVAP